MQNVCSVSDKLYDKPGQKYLAAGRLVELSLAFGKSGVQWAPKLGSSPDLVAAI